jgi:hypothetical protein
LLLREVKIRRIRDYALMYENGKINSPGIGGGG